MSRPPVAGSPITHVVAGVLRDTQGRVLLAQRGEGRHLAGMWEFPGGKVEPGETAARALARELDEELGIAVLEARPLIAVEHRYPSQRVLLDVYELVSVRGKPHGKEGQALRWAHPQDMPGLEMPDADRPVVNALRLPPCLTITPEPKDPAAFLDALESTLAAGARMVQLRAKTQSVTALARLAERALRLCRNHAARLLLNGPPELARDLGLDGVHLDAARLAALVSRPLPHQSWVGASCHDRASLQRAAALGLDYATLSPVRPTRSHPGAAAIGWARFSAWRAGLPLPVYALGGMCPADVDEARSHGAQGVAGISAFWARSGAGAD